MAVCSFVQMLAYTAPNSVVLACSHASQTPSWIMSD